MKKIVDIYKEYKITPSLGAHMFRVAAIATLICDNFDEPLPKEDIVTACLLHDMGNIIKFNMNILPEFFEPEGVEYWRKIQNEFVEKYGKNEHKATVEIVKELGVKDEIVKIIDGIDFLLFDKHQVGNDMSMKIAVYSDSRVDPHGVVSYEARMEEGKKRYQNHKSTFGAVNETERQRLVECGRQMERQIFAKCRIKPEDINNETINPIISELKNFVIRSSNESNLV